MWDTKYRPLKFADVLGQEGSVRLLKARLKNGSALDTNYIFEGGHGQGKCVTGDTLVTTHQGLVPIKSLMGPGKIDPLAVRVQQERGVASSAYSYRGGWRETVRIRTYLGFELEGTPNHRIQVLAPSGTIEWKRLGDIMEGDYACIVRKGLFGTGADLSGFYYERSPHDHSSVDFAIPPELTPEWGFLMGCMIGDGACRHRSSVSISCAEPDVRKAILHTLRELGGEGHETPDKRRHGLVALRCCRVQFRAFLAFLGVGYVGAAHKTIPWSVLASPKPVVAAFLRGYFECDGSVSGQALESVTKSRELARQLQVLLLQFGIVSRRFKKRHRKYGIFWRVRIMGTSVDLFRSQIGFVSKRKHNALGNFVNKVHAKGRRRLSNAYDVVPFQTEPLRRFYTGLSSKQRNRDTSHFFRARRGEIACTTRQVERIATEFRGTPGASHFIRLQEAGYIFDPVTHVSTGKAQVFDLNVPQGEMFAANGFMNHNTTLARVHARAMLCQQIDLSDPEPCNECDNCRAILDDNSMAFVELDAASRGTIDSIRAIVDDLPFAVYGAAKRLYLFDEAHRMGQGAQDVLLKPLEEKRLVGLFCTTEPEKIRGTIRSRCETYTIRKVTRDQILGRMNKILDAEGVPHDDEAVLTVIDASGGHIRDILNRLEMIAQTGMVNLETVRDHLHLQVHALYYKVLLSLGQPRDAVALVDQICEQVSPDEARAGLAEAAMNSYRLANGMLPEFAMVDRALGQQVYDLFGDKTVALADFFLRNRFVTQVGILTDVLSLTAGVPQKTAQASVAPPVVVAAAAPPAAAAAPPAAPPAAAALEPAPAPPKGDFGPGGRFVREDTLLGETDKFIQDEPGGRRKQEKRESVNLSAAAEDVETRPMLPQEWSHQFEKHWRERRPGGKA